MVSVLITGGAGFIAPNLISRLLKRGDTVLAVDNLCRGTLSNLTEPLEHPRFAFAKVDLTDLGAYRSCLDGHTGIGPITEVWHLAANSDIPAGIADSSIDLRDTFMTTFNTLKVMAERGVRRILFASSSAIYGDLGERELTEDIGPLFPISNYGAMKLASEAAITAAVESFLESALLFRFPNVVGVPATHGVILDFILRLRDQPAFLEVLGDGTQQKAYLHVSDLVDAMLTIQARATRAKVSAFNIGSTDDGVTVRRIAEETVAVVAPQAELRFGTGNRGWVGDVPRFRYSTAKLQALGWRPSLDSMGAVRRAIREIAAQGRPR
ncbi:MAG: NAD-dependent epimerase/dehydratase family protein [Alphaproteobacteria bacterium]|nr:NAD-dependent epimerase/dehydratase family protein [Alphaproteobacteria bacterium]